MLYKKIALAALALFSFEKNFGQQLLSLALLAEQPQSSATNPAFLPQKKWTISGPSAWADGHFSNGLALQDLIVEDASGQKRLDVQPILDGPADGLEMNGAWGAELFSLAFRQKNWSVSGGYGRRFGASVAAKRQLFDFFWKGNAAYIGQTVRLAPDFSVFGSQQISLGAAFEKGKWQIGGRGKLLFGGSSAQKMYGDESSGDIKITTDADIYQLKLESDFAFFTTGDLLQVSQNGSDFDLKTGNLTAKGTEKGNSGFAVDLGLRFKASEKMRFGLAATDLFGQIKRNKSTIFYAGGVAEFNGAEFPATAVLNSESLDFSSQLDSVLTAVGFSSYAGGGNSVTRFKTFLPQKMTATAVFDHSEKWQFGAAAFFQHQKKGFTTAAKAVSFAVSARRFFFEKRLAIAAQPIFSSVSGLDFGASLTARLGFLNLFAASDNVFSAFQPFKTDRANFALGISTAF